MSGTAMPEASMHEDSDGQTRNYRVWLSRQSRRTVFDSRVAIDDATNHLAEADLRFSTRAANQRHTNAAFIGS